MPKVGRRIGFTDLSNPWQRFRSQLGISQTTLARLLNLRQSAISKYEQGGAPKPEIAKRFVALAKKHRVRMSMDEVYANLEMS